MLGLLIQQQSTIFSSFSLSKLMFFSEEQRAKAGKILCNFTFKNMATAKINTILHVIFTYFTWLRHKLP